MKNIVLKIIGVSLAVIILIQSNIYIVMAESTSDLENQKNETNAKIEETQKHLEQVQEEKSDTIQQVEELSTKISDYEEQIEKLNIQIDDLKDQIAEEEENLKKAEEEYKKQEKLMETRLIEIQEKGETSYLDFLLTSSNNLVDFISNYYFVKELVNADTDFLESIQKQKEEIEAAKEKLQENKKELDTAKASKEGISTQLKAAKSEKDQHVTQLSEDEQKLQQELDELKDHEKTIKDQIQRMKEEYDRQRASSRNNSASGQTNSNTAASAYGFGWPVSNTRIGTGYGVAGRYWSSGHHTGVDFPVPSGTAVFAVGDGQVFDTGYSSAYGNYVEIYHGNSVYSFYAHGSAVGVSKGQMVNKGQQIMSSGATGNVTGAHLHFEIRSPGFGYSSCINPMPYLP